MEGSSRFWIVEIIVGDVGDADDKHAHSAFGSVNDAGWDVNQRALGNGLFHAIKHDQPFAFQNIVQLGRSLVVVLPGTVDIHGMRQAATPVSSRLISRSRQPQVLRSRGT